MDPLVRKGPDFVFHQKIPPNGDATGWERLALDLRVHKDRTQAKLGVLQCADVVLQNANPALIKSFHCSVLASIIHHKFDRAFRLTLALVMVALPLLVGSSIFMPV